MDRRKFIKKMSLAATSGLFLGGLPLTALRANGQLQRIAAASGDTNRVLVLIQMHGGNDGLNTIIPVNLYDEYFDLRPNIAIPDNGSRSFIEIDGTLPEEKRAAFHPDMTGIKSLYDEGKCAIVQGVAYENLNQSHFRSRDIWFMGGEYDDYIGSGWMGRYLDTRFPGYPESYPNSDMEDPLAIEIGRGVSLAFHRSEGIPASLSLNNPQQFYDLINGVGGELPADVMDSYYGEELKWIMDMETKANEYSGRLKEVYDAGENSNVSYDNPYPNYVPGRYANNGLADQLKLIARLIKGGCKTKIFLARIGGFDTHANQVDSKDATVGPHAALLFHLSAAVRAFQTDLKNLGLEDRVLTMTFSEFGRRAASNDSYGTDHGTAAPMMLFGKGVKAGVIGSNPDLTDLNYGNLRMQHDYRQVFTTVLQDWMCASDQAMTNTMFDGFTDRKLDLIDESAVGLSEKSDSSALAKLKSCYPNPATDRTTFAFTLQEAGEVQLSIYDTSGKLRQVVSQDFLLAGNHELYTVLNDLERGTYIYTLQVGREKYSKSLAVV